MPKPVESKAKPLTIEKLNEMYSFELLYFRELCEELTDTYPTVIREKNLRDAIYNSNDRLKNLAMMLTTKKEKL